MTTLFHMLFMQYLTNQASFNGRASHYLESALGAGLLYAILLDIVCIAGTIKLIFF